jgi:hypothetical protein
VSSAKFMAHVSLAVDSRNRVWLAWDDSEANRGKDIGVITTTGTALHASRIRTIRKRRAGRTSADAQGLAAALDAEGERISRAGCRKRRPDLYISVAAFAGAR